MQPTWWRVVSTEGGTEVAKFLVLVVQDRIAVVTAFVTFFDVGESWTQVRPTLERHGFVCTIDGVT